MAYEIISQNNNTTTLSDGTNTITVPGYVNLATSTSYTISEVNNNTATLEGSDGSVIRDVPCVVVLAGGGGSGPEIPDQTGHSGEFLTTDGFVLGWAKTEQIQREVMPQADETNVNKIYEFVGTTDATYTNGYFYKNQATTTYDSTVTFEVATLSASTMACSGSDFAAFVAQWGSGNITTITNGTITYDQSGGLLVFVGKDSSNDTVCTFQLYTEDYQDAGFTITGTLQDGDVFAFTCSVEVDTVTYAWVRINTQPQPTAAEIGAVTQQTSEITLNSANWSSHTQTKTVSGVTADNTVIVSPVASSASDYAAAEILCTAQGTNSLTFTCVTDPVTNILVNVVILN